MAQVKEILASLLLDSGFKKIGTYWRREHGETFQLAHIQRSSYSNRYFLNLGVVYKELQPDLVPTRMAGSHLEFRPGETRSQKPGDRPDAPSFFGYVNAALDEDNDWPSDKRIELIRGPMWQDVQDTFSRYSTLQSACLLALLPSKVRAYGMPLVSRTLLEHCGGEIEGQEDY